MESIENMSIPPRISCSEVKEIFSVQSEKSYRELLFDALIREMKGMVKLSINNEQCLKLKHHLICDPIYNGSDDFGISFNYIRDNAFILEARDSLLLIRKYLFEVIKPLSIIATKYSRVIAKDLNNRSYVGCGVAPFGEKAVLLIERLKNIMGYINQLSSNMQLSSFCDTITAYNSFCKLHGIDQIAAINQNIANSFGLRHTSFCVYSPSYALDMELIGITQKVGLICIDLITSFRGLVSNRLSSGENDFFRDIKLSLDSLKRKTSGLLDQSNLPWYEQTDSYSVHRKRIVQQNLILLEDLLLNVQSIVYYFLNKKVKNHITAEFHENQVSGIILDNYSKKIHEYVRKLKPFIEKHESH